MTGSATLGRLRRALDSEYLPVLGTLLLVGVGSVVAVRSVDLGVVRATVREADTLLLAVALVVYAVSWPIRGRRYEAVLRAMGHRCGLGFLTAAVFLSQTANLVVPARAGDGVRAYLLNDHDEVPYPTGVASLAVERVFDLVAITALGGVASAWLLGSGKRVAVGNDAGLGVTAALAVAALALTLSVVTVLLARSDRPFAPPLRARVGGPRVSRALDALVSLGVSVRRVAETPRSLATISAWSLLVWALDVLTAVLVLAALVGETVSGPGLVAVGTLAVSVGNLAKVLPLSQGGIGLYEAAFTGLVVGITPVPAGIALTAAILDHALKNAVTLVGGAVAGIALNASPTSLPDTGDGEAHDAANPGD